MICILAMYIWEVLSQNWGSGSVWGTNKVGNGTAIDSGHTDDRRTACPRCATLGLSAHSSVGLQHGPAVDGRGLDATVKRYNFVQIYYFFSNSCSITLLRIILLLVTAVLLVTMKCRTESPWIFCEIWRLLFQANKGYWYAFIIYCC